MLFPSDGFSLRSVLTAYQGRAHAKECLANRKGSQWWLYRHLSHISLFEHFFLLLVFCLYILVSLFLCFVGFGVYVYFLFFVCLNIGWKGLGVGEVGRVWEELGEGKVLSENNMNYFAKIKIKLCFLLFLFKL